MKEKGVTPPSLKRKKPFFFEMKKPERGFEKGLLYFLGSVFEKGLRFLKRVQTLSPLFAKKVKKKKAEFGPFKFFGPCLFLKKRAISLFRKESTLFQKLRFLFFLLLGFLKSRTQIKIYSFFKEEGLSKDFKKKVIVLDLLKGKGPVGVS